MKPIKDEIRNELAERFGIEGEELSFLAGGREDSDGIVQKWKQFFGDSDSLK